MRSRTPESGTTRSESIRPFTAASRAPQHLSCSAAPRRRRAHRFQTTTAATDRDLGVRPTAACYARGARVPTGVSPEVSRDWHHEQAAVRHHLEPKPLRRSRREEAVRRSRTASISPADAERRGRACSIGGAIAVGRGRPVRRPHHRRHRHELELLFGSLRRSPPTKTGHQRRRRRRRSGS